MLSLMHGAGRVYVWSCRITGVGLLDFKYFFEKAFFDDLYCKMLDIFMIKVK